MSPRNQLAHATYNLVASQRPRRDARLLHDGGHGAGGGAYAPVNADMREAQTTVGLNPTSQLSHSVNEYSNSQLDISHSINENAKSDNGLSNVNSERTECGQKSDTWEDARQRNASERGYEYLPPSTVERTENGQEPDTDCLRTDGELKADVELCRIAIGLRQSAQMRLWIIFSEHTRATGYNYLDRNQFAALLERYGIKYTRHNLNRWLRAGQGVYWRLTTYGRVYLISYENLAVKLTTLAYSHALYDLVSTNTPGQTKAMYIEVASSNLLQFEAQCYKAWHANRNNPTISRFILKRLWNKNERSLRHLEKLGDVTAIRNTVETDDPCDVPLDTKGNLRGDVKTIPQANGKTIYQFNLPNTYLTKSIRQHHRRGASRRVSYRIRNLLQSEALAGFSGQGANAPGELCHTGRFYCETDKTAKTSRRRGNTNRLYVPDKPRDSGGIVWCIY